MRDRKINSYEDTKITENINVNSIKFTFFAKSVADSIQETTELPNVLAWLAAEYSVSEKMSLAANDFDYWMKKYENSQRTSGSLDNPNKAIVEFLYEDEGYKYIKTFDELCLLSELVKARYKTTNPPCELIDFAKVTEKLINYKFFGDQDRHLSADLRLLLATDGFDCWMRKFEKNLRKKGFLDAPNKALVYYLTADSGFKYIKTYDELCMLSDLVRGKGYETSNPPCQPIDFDKQYSMQNLMKR